MFGVYIRNRFNESKVNPNCMVFSLRARESERERELSVRGKISVGLLLCSLLNYEQMHD